MRKLYKVLIGVASFLLISGVVVCCVVIPFVGKASMLHPDRKDLPLFPDELGMVYENVTFSTSDSLDLKGWFIEPINSSDPNANITVIVLHGYSHSMYWMLDHYGQGLYDEGYRLFFFDSRNRGESPNTELGVTWGIDEVKDVRAAVDFVKAQPEVNSSAVVLFAESQGAATILFYTAQYNDVAAIIPDSSWAYGDVMIKQAYPIRSGGFPWFIFGQITISLLENHYGFTFADISPAAVAPDITVPTYLIHGNADEDINPEDSAIILSELPVSTTKLIWRVDGRAHVEAYLEPDYFSRIAQFIADAL